MRSFPPVVVLVLLASRVLPQTVKVDFEKETNFSRYKTYDWVLAQTPAENPVNHIRITRAVERELELKGLKKSMEGPDLRVTYLAKIEKKLKGQGYQTNSPWQAPSDLRTVVDFKKVSEGTLIVELIDNATKLTVWRGVVTQPAPPPDEVGPVIDTAVKKVLASYPPGSN